MPFQSQNVPHWGLAPLRVHVDRVAYRPQQTSDDKEIVSTCATVECDLWKRKTFIDYRICANLICKISVVILCFKAARPPLAFGTQSIQEKAGRQKKCSKKSQKKEGCKEKEMLDSWDFCFAFAERFTVVMVLYLQFFTIFSLLMCENSRIHTLTCSNSVYGVKGGIPKGSSQALSLGPCASKGHHNIRLVSCCRSELGTKAIISFSLTWPSFSFDDIGVQGGVLQSLQSPHIWLLKSGFHQTWVPH